MQLPNPFQLESCNGFPRLSDGQVAAAATFTIFPAGAVFKAKNLLDKSFNLAI